MTETNFKVGDKVRVEFEGVISPLTAFDGVGYTIEQSLSLRTYVKVENLTLIEPAKPALEVNQVWISACRFERKVLAFTESEVAFLNLYTKKMHVINKDQFINEFSNILKET